MSRDPAGLAGPGDHDHESTPAWHGQWLQTAAECLGISPRALSVARTRVGDPAPDDSAEHAPGDGPGDRLRLSFEPGRVEAIDPSSDRRTVMTIRQWGPARWARTRAALADDPVLERALTSGRIHARLRQTLMRMNADPMPGRSELSAECDCGRDGCSHVASLLVAAADEIASDPLLLLMLRGVDRGELGGTQLDEVPPGWPRAHDPGVSAESAWARSRAPLAPVAARPPIERAQVTSPPADSGLSRAALGALADLAAHRAAALLTAATPEADGGMGVLAERLIERGLAPATVANRSGLSPDEMEIRRRARALAGEAGVAVLLDRFDADPDDLADGATALGGRVRSRANVVTSGPTGRQLRIDRLGRWWLLRSDPDLGWVLADGPSGSPTTLCATAE